MEALVSANFPGRVLIEKPAFDRCRPLIEAPFARLAVAYNLRFHPVIQRLRQLLQGETIISVQAYMGQYLPDWRPATDYRQSYSASAVQGGGALRDLSHELDYLAWIFGDWQSVTALGGHLSALEIDSDDLFVLLMQMSRCPVVSVQVSYLDRTARRHIVVNTERMTVEADLIAGTIDYGNGVEALSVGRDFTYEAMHQAMLTDDDTTLCSLDEGVATLQLIEAAEQANRNRKWIIR
jgi:predicted dehydrogenase